jgi:fermentation-respiration switch protein FrsA (DUF1100 family)
VNASRPAPLERRVFLACAAVVVLHALLAGLVFMRPGAARSDHLLAAFVPTAVVVLIAVLYARLPAGVRAASALLVGVFAVVAGSVALMGAVRGGALAHDLIGVLVLPAGAVLVALGVWVLWVSRKRGGRLWWRITRRGLLVIAALLVGYWVVLPIAFAIVATERPREIVAEAALGRPARDVTLRTDDGLDLHAWYVASRNGAAIITFPRTWTQDHARMLAEHGYGVLLVDMRGYGDSEGDPNAYGWGSGADIDAAVSWLQARPEVRPERIGGLGLSVGGEQMIEAAGANEGLRAVVSEGAGLRSVREALVREGPNVLELALQYPADLMQTAAVWVLSGTGPPPSLRAAAAAISPRAVFFVYGEDGQAIEAAINVPCYEAAGQPKQIWEVPAAGHTGGLAADPAEYERRIVGFFDRYLLGRR